MDIDFASATHTRRMRLSDGRSSMIWGWRVHGRGGLSVFDTENEFSERELCLQ